MPRSETNGAERIAPHFDAGKGITGEVVMVDAGFPVTGM